MKKLLATNNSLLRFFATFFLFLQSGYIWAQTEIDTSFRHQMNTIFGPLDKSKVPHGLLKDYAMEFTNQENASQPLANQ